MVVGVALEDEVCPPETSYAAYRLLGGEKELWLYPDSGHGNAHDYPAQETAWLEGQIGVGHSQVDGLMTVPQSHAEAFWERVEAELAELSPNVTLEADAFYSQPEWDVYRMRYSSTGGHRLHALVFRAQG